jgi:hypothetical protein
MRNFVLVMFVGAVAAAVVAPVSSASSPRTSAVSHKKHGSDSYRAQTTIQNAGATAAVPLYLGQSKKLGGYTVVCTSAKIARTSTRIVLHPGYGVTVGVLRVNCRASTPSPTPTPNQSAPTPTPTPTAPQGSRTNPFPIGTRAAGTTWAVTVNNTNFDAWAALQAANQFNSPPSAGGQDVLANLTVTYLGAGSSTLTDLVANLGVVGQGGVEYRSYSNSCGVPPKPREIDYNTLFSEATIQLNLCWQVASADVPTLLFVYNEQSWFALH